MAWVPGTNTIFYTEKNTGKIRVVKAGQLKRTVCADLPVDNDGEQGGLGIVLHPDYATNHFLYVYFSSRGAQDNRIARFEVVDDRCTNKTIIFSGIPDYFIHNGGQLEFVDGYLFVTTGDAGNQGSAQNLNTLAGKVLRLNPDGSIPEDNPFPFPSGHPAVWSYGHRNGFGLAARADTSQLFQSENGPGCDDEVNIILEGENYGWGQNYPCSGPGVGTTPTAALREWTPTIAPTDLTWYRGRLDVLHDTLLMGDYNDGSIHRFELNEDGTDITDESIVHVASRGVLDVARGPRGWLYFLTPSAIKRIKEVP